MKKLIEFDNAVEALGDSMLANIPEERIKDVQQFREYFEQIADVKLRKLGLRLIDECVVLDWKNYTRNPCRSNYLHK